MSSSILSNDLTNSVVRNRFSDDSSSNENDLNNSYVKKTHRIVDLLQDDDVLSDEKAKFFRKKVKSHDKPELLAKNMFVTGSEFSKIQNAKIVRDMRNIFSNDIKIRTLEKNTHSESCDVNKSVFRPVSEQNYTKQICARRVQHSLTDVQELTTTKKTIESIDNKTIESIDNRSGSGSPPEESSSTTSSGGTVATGHLRSLFDGLSHLYDPTHDRDCKTTTISSHQSDDKIERHDICSSQFLSVDTAMFNKNASLSKQKDEYKASYLVPIDSRVNQSNLFHKRPHSVNSNNDNTKTQELPVLVHNTDQNAENIQSHMSTIKHTRKHHRCTLHRHGKHKHRHMHHLCKGKHCFQLLICMFVLCFCYP